MSWTICSDLDPDSLTHICRCHCGHVQRVRELHLRVGFAGCEKCRNTPHSARYCGKVPEAYFRKLARNADSRGIDFDLAIEDVEEVFAEQDETCALSGLRLFFAKGRTPGTASVDRIDSSLGYARDNIQITHKDINMSKGSMSQEKYVWYCTLIAANQNRRLEQGVGQ